MVAVCPRVFRGVGRWCSGWMPKWGARRAERRGQQSPSVPDHVGGQSAFSLLGAGAAQRRREAEAAWERKGAPLLVAK